MADGEKGGDAGVNVVVLLRCRPATDREVIERTPQVVSCNDALREVTLYQSTKQPSQSKTFRFDKVFGPDSAQEKLYKQAIVPIVQEVMDGFNCTIFAYGQTGTGKTYTMEGGPRDSTDGCNLSAEAGVIPRSIKQIFDQIESSHIDSTVKVSYMELYNEELTDLLSFEDDASKKLRLLEDRSGVVVHGLEEIIVRNTAEIYQVLDRGTAKRRTAATLLNKQSSRSHSVFTVTIHLKETTPDGEDVIKIGKLNLVDLAGSENISRSGAKDSRAREAGSINQSLLTLGRVITALVEHSGHIPYRDSKLTRLLRDSLGGRTKTCIIATIAPTVQCLEETLSTLDYAHRAKNIRNKPELNQKVSKTTMIKDLAAEIERLRVDLTSAREKNGVYLSMDRYEQGEMERVQLRDAVKALKAELEVEETNHAQVLEQLKASHEVELDGLQAELDVSSKGLADCQDQLHEAHISIQERQFMILSHQRAEHALAAHAQRLTSELASAARDMEVLFAKLGELVELQSGDRTVLHGMREYVQMRMDQMGTFVADAVNSQQQYLLAIAASASALKEKKEGDLTQLRDQVSATEARIGGLQQAIRAGLAEMSASFHSTLAGAREHSLAFSSKAAAALQSTQQEAVAAVGSLASALGSKSAQVQELGVRQASGVESALEALHSVAAVAQGELTGAASSLVQLQQSVSSKHEDSDRALASAASALEASFQREQQALMQQMVSMLQAFSLERSREVTSALEEVRQQVASKAADICTEAAIIHHAAVSSVGKLKDSEAGMASSVCAAGQQLQQECVILGSELKDSESRGAASLSALQTMFSQQATLLSTYTKELSVRIDVGSTAATSAIEAAKGSSDGAAAVATQVCQELQQTVESQHSADVKAVEHIQQAATGAGQKLTDFAQMCIQGTGDTKKSVVREVDQRLAIEVQLSTVPAKRSLEVPSVESVHELLCPPEDVVLQQYRREKAQMLRGTGSKYASLLQDPQAQQNADLAGITIRRPRSPMMAEQENQEMEMSDIMPASPMSLAQAKAVAGPRSKIPGAPTSQADSFRHGLMDVTNGRE